MCPSFVTEQRGLGKLVRMFSLFLLLKFFASEVSYASLQDLSFPFEVASTTLFANRHRFHMRRYDFWPRRWPKCHL
jgi:hypothetical protein